MKTQWDQQRHIFVDDFSLSGEEGCFLTPHFYHPRKPDEGLEAVESQAVGWSPRNAAFEVGGERRTWQNNKALILDTSFEHSTFNGEDNPDRIVLLIDFWHPGLSPQEREALEMVYEIRNEYDSGGYIEGYVKRGEKEKLTGALNPFKKLFFNK
eukprot:CAMPEP_0194594466 /NCGR_PEP_ID=MMETSP0292-20121207/24262_1 /TAXON_ID=39354 /ORGANISM="Heterosigma akashiwo, Strain CCMP2393" /LENGTH=153 /DNA_ID=CAMNT_0039453905 /DNA_START=569 /DNA_END=1031 /DNA_ORIENTATION=-